MNSEVLKMLLNITGFSLNMAAAFILMNLGYVGIKQIRYRQSIMPKVTSTFFKETLEQKMQKEIKDYSDQINNEISVTNNENDSRSVKSRRWVILTILGSLLQLISSII